MRYDEQRSRRLRGLRRQRICGPSYDWRFRMPFAYPAFLSSSACIEPAVNHRWLHVYSCTCGVGGKLRADAAAGALAAGGSAAAWLSLSLPLLLLLLSLLLPLLLPLLVLLLFELLQLLLSLLLLLLLLLLLPVLYLLPLLLVSLPLELSLFLLRLLLEKSDSSSLLWWGCTAFMVAIVAAAADASFVALAESDISAFISASIFLGCCHRFRWSLKALISFCTKCSCCFCWRCCCMRWYCDQL